MAIDNADFDTIFAEATAEVEAGGGADASTETKKQNARVHLGDGEVIDPQAEDEVDESEGDEESDEDESDEDESDDSETDDEDDSDTPSEFDFESHKDELVKVKVDGEEVSVPLGEALKGYMRQADYTRKTQKIAELQSAADWGKQMREAVLEDPQGVIDAIAQSMGLQNKPKADDSEYTSDDPELAPVLSELKETKAALRELQQRLERQDQAQVEASVRAEVAALQAKYPDFDPHEVLPVAIRSNGAVGIEEAYFIVKGQKSTATKSADDAKAAQVKAAALKEKKKREAAAAVSKGSKRNTAPAPTPTEGDSFEDMLKFELSRK